jgi:hypothetical protein
VPVAVPSPPPNDRRARNYAVRTSTAVPSLRVNQLQSANTNFYIRQRRQQRGIEPSVGCSSTASPLAPAQTPICPDVRIEVLRGPQSTLLGKTPGRCDR